MLFNEINKKKCFFGFCSALKLGIDIFFPAYKFEILEFLYWIADVRKSIDEHASIISIEVE